MSLIDVFTMIRTDLVLAAGGLVLARGPRRAGRRTDVETAIRVAGVEVDLLQAAATWMAWATASPRFVERKAAETLGLDPRGGGGGVAATAWMTMRPVRSRSEL